MPATVFLLVFFVFPFFVVLAVAFGRVDDILRLPVPAWNPLQWRPAVLTFTLSNVTHADGLYQAALVRTFLYVGIATFLCLLVGYPLQQRHMSVDELLARRLDRTAIEHELRAAANDATVSGALGNRNSD